MERWALVSGLCGDLDLYEQIQSDLKKKNGMAHLFVLGDMVGPDHDCNALLSRLRQPKRSDLQPNCIYGWWEEQLLAEYGYRGDQKPEVLDGDQDPATYEKLRAAVHQDHLNWLASLQFGFVELDCGLIHGSSADVGDCLLESTSPLILLDRLTRLDVNRLFTARSGQQFRLQLTSGQIQSKVVDPLGETAQEHTVPKRSVIGIGSGVNYTLYDPASDHIEFLTVADRSGASKLGFG
jgi:hypothetical protein